MKKTMLVIAAGMLALTGAAMADQAIVVDGNLHTPAGDVPVEQNTGGLPLPGTGLPIREQADGANVILDENGIPVQVQTYEGGSRVNARCTQLGDLNADGTLDTVCKDEPEVPWMGNDVLTIGPDGLVVKQWATVDSGQVFTFIPEEVNDQVPLEQREALESAHDQVNAQAAAQMVEDSQRHGNSARPKFFAGTDDMLEKNRLRSLAERLRLLVGPLPEGSEQAMPEGWEQLWAGDTEGLSTGTMPGSSSASAEEQALQSGSGGDLASMAVMAAVVGGAILAPMALYHRIRSNHTLNNKTRQTVYDAVLASPGSGVNDAAKAANCSYSTAAYHLERLVEERLLIVSEDGRRARYFKNGGSFSQAEREFVPILQSQECMNVLQVIVENPWCYRAEVAQKLGVSGPTVNWHLKKLMTVGVVKEMREGRVSYLYADKKQLTTIGANLVGKMPEDLVQRLRFENKPAMEFVEPAMAMPETTVPEIGVGEYDSIELAPLPEAVQA